MARGGWFNETKITEQMVRDAWAKHGTLQGVHKSLGISWDKATCLVDRYGLDRPEAGEVVDSEMSEAEFLALLRAMRAVPFLAWLRDRDA